MVSSEKCFLFSIRMFFCNSLDPWGGGGVKHTSSHSTIAGLFSTADVRALIFSIHNVAL